MVKQNWLVVALYLAVVPVTAQAQGTIQGTVRSSESGLGIGSARVELPTLGRVTLTNVAGAFTMAGVAAGTYSLEVRVIGYGLQTVEVTVASGQTANVDVMLGVSAFELDAIVVTGTRSRPRTVT